jgi:hypothetical protein
MHKTLPLLLFCFGLAFQNSFAQTTSCAQTLRLATSTYEQGRLHELPELLKNCLNSGFTKQEKVTAYKLLTLSYIYLEEPEKADEAMLKLLQTDHYFEINEAVDPAEFVALYKTFRTNPIYRLGVIGGPNLTWPNLISSNASSDGIGKYSYKPSFQVGIDVEIPLSSRFILNPQLQFQSKSFSYSQKGKEGTADTIFNISSVEAQKWLSLPITLQYSITESKLNPYISLGVSVDYLLTAMQTPLKLREGYQDVKEENINISDQRKKTNINAIAAAGIKYKIAGGYLLAEARFIYGLQPMNDKSMIYRNPSIFNNYNFVDGIFSQNSVLLNVGYVYNVFHPKKKNIN